MAKNFEEVKCSAVVIFKIFSDSELTADQVRNEILMMEIMINEKLGVTTLSDKKLKIGTRVHIKEVGLK